jgi:hypothetical protein
MVDRAPAPDSSKGTGLPSSPGISWQPGDEDYPFAARPGETAVAYFERWLMEAPYASVERFGVRFIHETDVSNVVNHITADVGLLRARLDEFGDRVLTAADHAATVERIEAAVTRLTEALAALGRDDGEPH